MKIKIQSEDELMAIAAEAIHILANLRHFTKKWHEAHGVEVKQRKQYYEGQADALIERLNVVDHRQANQIKIEIN